MRRDPNLFTLSRQHQHALALCVLSERELPEKSADALASRIIAKYDAELARHFEVEEAILFPALDSYSELAPLVFELIGDHRRLGELVLALRTHPDKPTVREFTTLLGDHARKEERQLFERMQDLLGPLELDRVGEQLRAALPDEAF